MVAVLSVIEALREGGREGDGEGRDKGRRDGGKEGGIQRRREGWRSSVNTIIIIQRAFTMMSVSWNGVVKDDSSLR